MNVAVPKTGNDGLPGAINASSIFGDLHFPALANLDDLSVGKQNHGIVERGSGWRRINRSTNQREGLRIIRNDMEWNDYEEQRQGKRRAETPNHE
jgi:hypothetical protein